MAEVNLYVIHEDLIRLTKEIRELKKLFKNPELGEDTIARIKMARARIKEKYVSHDEMLKEFTE